MNSLIEKQENHKPKKLLTVETVAERCDIPKITIYEMARQNRIGGVVRFGRNLRFDLEKLEAWLDAGGQAFAGGWKRDLDAGFNV